MEATQQKSYSAEVRLELRADGRIFDLASVGPNRFIPREPLELDACDAEVAMLVDGDLFVWPVRLPHGALPFDKSVLTQSRGEMQKRGNVQGNAD